MAHAVEEKLNAVWPPASWRDVRVLVAVSGGADSVALLRAMARIAGDPQRLIVAHFNHRWRGPDSDADARWVEHLAVGLGLPLVVERASGAAGGTTGRATGEDAARQQRYAFLTRAAYAHGARYVATGHTADDRVETFFHNLLRGTGIAGAVSLSPFRPLDRELVLARPMLHTWRHEIEDYLHGLGQPYRSDCTNSEPSYARNFLRHRIFPPLAARYGERFPQRMTGFLDDLEELHHHVRAEADRYWDAVEHLPEYRDLLASAQRSAPYDAAECGARQSTLADPSGGGGRSPLVVPSRTRFPATWIVVREALRQRWHENGWPLGPVTRKHWQAIERAWDSPPPSEHPEKCLPGKNLADLPGSLRLYQFGAWIGIRPIARENSSR